MYDGVSVDHGASVWVDDSATLMVTKQLIRSHRRESPTTDVETLPGVPRSGRVDAVIRACTGPELRAVAAAAGVESPEFAEHCQVPQHDEKDGPIYVTAWLGATPVGHLKITWTGSSAPEVRKHISDTPEFTSISVWPPELRSHGIGRTLIAAAETVVKARGYGRVGLGVQLTNHRAHRLYEQLGYRDWDHGTYHDRWVEADESGAQIAHADPCQYLLKELT